MSDGYYKCEACGAVDTIVTNGDAGICTECGSAENYQYVEEDNG